MRKGWLLFVVVFMVTIPVVAADLHYVNLGAIAHIEMYKDDVLLLLNNQDYLESYIPDAYWKATNSKAWYAEKLVGIYRTVCSYPEDSNQEYLLLKAMISEFLYHLDASGYYEKTLENFTAVGKLEGRDYRFK